MSFEGQMQDPEIQPSDPSPATPVPAVELFEQHQHSTHIGEELRALLTLAIPVVLSELGWMTMTIVDLIMLFMLAAQWIFSGRGVDPTVAVLTRSYVSLLNWGTFPLLVYGGFRRYLQGVGLVRPVAFALITANLVNLAFNWI